MTYLFFIKKRSEKEKKHEVFLFGKYKILVYVWTIWFLGIFFSHKFLPPVFRFLTEIFIKITFILTYKSIFVAYICKIDIYLSSTAINHDLTDYINLAVPEFSELFSNILSISIFATQMALTSICLVLTVSGTFVSALACSKIRPVGPVATE